MDKKPLYRLGEKHTPPPKRNDEEMFNGKILNLILDGGEYYLECDVGSFVSKFIKYRITQKEFEAVRHGEIEERDLLHKYWPGNS
ncbi:hypothetical protein F9L33_13700 [Amylibacter sp. SFDW26]|uniref:hypothetical protein n=1 Tax=Amylibacter sp. SFDW26 TaxID=2652722 RepID=UPI00126173C1|nr:hypothetical protein [Amylibacter sp. SFDW26]KAB7610352.1 hypothetical protein F9L33_13700 [Amylibacter sp. SFDW26]